MNNRQFETLAHWTTPEVVPLVYNKLLEQQTGSLNPIPAGVKSWVRSELILRQDLPESHCEVCNRWKKMMILSVVLSIGYS